MDTYNPLGKRFSPELKILLYCSRTLSNEVESAYLEDLLTQGVNWERFLMLAARHGLISLCHHTLAHFLHLDIPGEIRQKLQAGYVQNVADTFMLKNEVCIVSSTLDDADIPVIPHKGVTLGSRIYKNAVLREAGDIDIFVPANLVTAANSHLRTIGYEPLYKLSHQQEKKYFQRDHHYALVNKKKGILLEVHWDIADFSQAISVDWSQIWQRNTWFEFEKNKGELYAIRKFAPEDELLLLLIHGGLHRWEKLKWLVDINEFILGNSKLNWSLFMERAERWRIGRIARVGLNLSRELLATPVPMQIAEQIESDRRVRGLTSQVIDLIDSTKPPPQPDVKRVFFVMSLRDNWRDRLTYIKRLPTRLH